MDQTKLENIFESNWDEIKGQLKTQFGELTKKDIAQIEGSYDIFMGKLKKSYGYTKDEVEDAISEFLSSEGFDKVKSKVKKLKDNVEESSSNIKDVIEDYLQTYFNTIKEKTVAVEENVVDYVKENPAKILGAAVVVGYGLTKLIGLKK